MQIVKNASLRDSLISSIGEFLYDEGFLTDEITKFGILEIINLISDYHEEGNVLFPEIIITSDLKFFKTITNKELIIQEAVLSITEFKSALKLCAPLATNGWIIFIEVKEKKMIYGVLTAEMSATSISIYDQTVGQLKIENYDGIKIAYIRNISQKTVEVTGLKRRLIVSLTLDEPKDFSLDKIKTLSESISSKCNEKFKINIITFFEKTIDDALKNGHGNLIGVIDDEEKTVKEFKEKIKAKGGVYLTSPIDFESLITDSETTKSSESSINLKMYSYLLRSMLNHDGITIMSNKGKVIGYHILIDDYINPEDEINGGTRSKAFQSMQNCGMFLACFYKSQDGNIKIWQKE